MSNYYDPKKTFIDLVKDSAKLDLEQAFEMFIDEYSASENEDNRTLPQAAGVSEDDFTAVLDGEMSVTNLVKKYSKVAANLKNF